MSESSQDIKPHLFEQKYVFFVTGDSQLHLSFYFSHLLPAAQLYSKSLGNTTEAGGQVSGVVTEARQK